MLIRTALGVLSASALGAAALTPVAASAHGYGGDHDELRVTVCKYVTDSDDRDEEFDIDVWTDEEERSASLEHRECKKLRLDFDDNKLYLFEDVDHDDWDVHYKISGDWEKARVRHDTLRVKFDDDEDDPKLRIKVYNDFVGDDD